jgi:hypothetical protein
MAPSGTDAPLSGPGLAIKCFNVHFLHQGTHMLSVNLDAFPVQSLDALHRSLIAVADPSG